MILIFFLDAHAGHSKQILSGSEERGGEWGVSEPGKLFSGCGPILGRAPLGCLLRTVSPRGTANTLHYHQHHHAWHSDHLSFLAFSLSVCRASEGSELARGRIWDLNRQMQLVGSMVLNSA